MNIPKKPKLDDVPSRKFFYRHILRALHDEGGKAKSSAVCDKIINSFDIPDEVRQRKFSGGNNILINTIDWARYELVQKKYLAPTERGFWELSEQGKDAIRTLDGGGSPELQKLFGSEDASYPEVRRREKPADSPEFERPQIRIPTNPSHNFFFRPLLESLHEEGGKASCASLYNKITSRFDIPDDIKKREFSGENNVLRSAKQNLVDNGYLLSSSEREIWEMSEKGKAAIREFQDGESSETRKFFGDNDERYAEQPAEIHEEPVPGTFEKTERERHDLELIRAMDAYKFERLCGLLLKKTGYTDIKITERTRDGGYDGSGFLSRGLAKEKIAFQSKRYGEGNLISVNDIRAFSTVTRNVNAKQGVFFTTSDFTRGAIDEAEAQGIRLINGEKFLELLYEHKVCCAVSIDKNALDNV